MLSDNRDIFNILHSFNIPDDILSVEILNSFDNHDSSDIINSLIIYSPDILDSPNYFDIFVSPDNVDLFNSVEIFDSLENL